MSPDIQLRWVDRVVEIPSRPGRYDREKALQFRKFYDRTATAATGFGFQCGGISDWGWSDWIDVPYER